MTKKVPPAGASVLVNGLILPDPDSGEVFSNRLTVIEGSVIRHVNMPAEGWDLSECVPIDCSGCIIMPGLINAHTHAAMSLLRGLADDLPLHRWLNDYIFPSESRHVSPAFVRLGTRISCAEMALSGITTFADGYFFMEAAAEAALECGLRAVIAQGILDLTVPDAAAGSWKLRAEAFLRECSRNSLVTPALFCHSPYLCSPETLAAAGRLASEHGILLFSHVSETSAEVRDIVGRYGLRPVEHLNSLGILGADFIAVHCVHLSDQEKEILRDTGTAVVHCPESNMKLASGAAPTADFLQRGIRVAIGTDGPASNNNLDLFEEMRSASLMAKLTTGDPEALSALAVIRMATIEGARALHLDDRIGSLEPGKLADLIVIDLDKPHLSPLYDPISHLVYAARGSDVRDVMVNGELVVRNGALVTVDEEDLKVEARRSARRIGQDFGLPKHGAETTDVRQNNL